MEQIETYTRTYISSEETKRSQKTQRTDKRSPLVKILCWQTGKGDSISFKMPLVSGALGLCYDIVCRDHVPKQKSKKRGNMSKIEEKHDFPRKRCG